MSFDFPFNKNKGRRLKCCQYSVSNFSQFLLSHWSKVLIGVVGREKSILAILSYKVIGNENSSWADSVLKYINTHSNSTTRREVYCCLQFSFFSLGFTRPDLSVCRFVGGMKAGSSRRSCKPGCAWDVDPMLEGKGMLSVQLLFEQFHFDSRSSCLQYPSVRPFDSLCLAFWPGRSGPAPLRCFWYAGFVCKHSTSQSVY